MSFPYGRPLRRSRSSWSGDAQMTNRISAFPLGTVVGVSKMIGDLYSGTELTRTTGEVPLRSDPGEGHTKWRRLAHAVSSNQAKTSTGNASIGLIRAAMRPERTLDRKPRADIGCDELDQLSELDALHVLGTLSMLHRRLDAAISRNGEGT